jgi:acetyltransferase-like isoleucine patch superfamily enzyme
MGVATNFRKLNNRQEPITIGDNCVIACNAIIYCGVNLESNCLISENAIIRENTHISHDVIIGGNALIQYEVNIESGTRILNNSIISSKSRIGKNNFISWGFTSVSDKAFGGKGYTDDIIGPIIGNNNHIGPNVTMLSNIEIGNGNIIGACALISKSIGNNGVYYGIPAKFVKENKSDI